MIVLIAGASHAGKTLLAQRKLERFGYPYFSIDHYHVLQKESGLMAEVREVTHYEYKRTLHGLVGNGNSFRNDPVLRKQYINFKRAYWIWRAQQYLEGR